MKRLFALLFISILASGCAGGNLDVKSSERTEDVINSEMAYVLVSCAGNTSTGWIINTVHYNHWKEHQYVNIQPGEGANYRYRLVALYPGTYTMTRFTLSYGSATYSMSEAAKQQNELAKEQGGLFGSFTVEKGKINYLGDIKSTLRLPEGKPILAIQDNSPAALEYLRKNYPNLDAKQLLKYVPIRKGPYTE